MACSVKGVTNSAAAGVKATRTSALDLRNKTNKLNGFIGGNASCNPDNNTLSAQAHFATPATT